MTFRQKTRLIGDIHGQMHSYDLAVESVERSIQIGDFGIGMGQDDYWHDRVAETYGDTNHKFFRGNHDDPMRCRTMPNYLGDFGMYNDEVMWISGAWSIDWQWQMQRGTWWHEEELTLMQMHQAMDMYIANRPRVVLTHDCPSHVSFKLFVSQGLGLTSVDHQIKTRTSQFLEVLMDHHQPEEWYFGHWHITKSMQWKGTKFTCIGQYDWVDVEL